MAARRKLRGGATSRRPASSSSSKGWAKLPTPMCGAWMAVAEIRGRQTRDPGPRHLNWAIVRLDEPVSACQLGQWRSQFGAQPGRLRRCAGEMERDMSVQTADHHDKRWSRPWARACNARLPIVIRATKSRWNWNCG